jgi:hypothetical protein
MGHIVTVIVDRFFAKLGLEEEELKSSPKRGFLYIGMIYMLGLITAFLTMAILS